MLSKRASRGGYLGLSVYPWKLPGSSHKLSLSCSAANSLDIWTTHPTVSGCCGSTLSAGNQFQTVTDCFPDQPGSRRARLQNKVVLKGDRGGASVMRCQGSSLDSVILDFNRPSRRERKVHRSVSSDCQTQTGPRCDVFGTILFVLPFLHSWVAQPPPPLSIRPSVPPPLPVFLTFLVQFPFLRPGLC